MSYESPPKVLIYDDTPNKQLGVYVDAVKEIGFEVLQFGKPRLAGIHLTGNVWGAILPAVANEERVQPKEGYGFNNGLVAKIRELELPRLVILKSSGESSKAELDSYDNVAWAERKEVTSYSTPGFYRWIDELHAKHDRPSELKQQILETSQVAQLERQFTLNS
jgi:hypothetical protein